MAQSTQNSDDGPDLEAGPKKRTKMATPARSIYLSNTNPYFAGILLLAILTF
jgi:hypothetical protein